MSKRSKLLTRLLSWLVIITQLTAAAGVGAVAAIQPTPQMVQTAAQQAGLAGTPWRWFANPASQLAAAG